MGYGRFYEIRIRVMITGYGVSGLEIGIRVRIIELWDYD